MVQMPVGSNLQATRATVRALRRAERVTEADAALVRLAESTAAALDEARAGDAKPYAVAAVARAHRDVLGALLARADGRAPTDDIDELLQAAMTPTPGTPDLRLHSRGSD
jgi:hypothetical protein